MKKIAIYGAGGFGKEVAAILIKINEVSPQWDFIGFFDDGLEKATQISRYGKVLGGIKELQEWQENLSLVFAIANPAIIEKLFLDIKNPMIEFPNIVHPEAFFADPLSLTMGKGNIIVRGCTFSVDVTVGDFNIFNSLTALAHDVEVGSYNVFMPLTRVSGEVKIGNSNVFGINTMILQQLSIGNHTRTGPAAVLVRKTKDGQLYMGNPAKKTIL